MTPTELRAALRMAESELRALLRHIGSADSMVDTYPDAAAFWASGARDTLERIARTLPRRERSDAGKVVGGP